MYDKCLLAMQSEKSVTPKPIKQPSQGKFISAMQSDNNSMGCYMIMPHDMSATSNVDKSKLASPSPFAPSVSVDNEKTFQKSKLNITVNNYASRPVLKEVQTAEEMLLDLQAMRESLGLTPIKSKEPELEDAVENYSDSNCILEMRSPEGKENRRQM